MIIPLVVALLLPPQDSVGSSTDWERYRGTLLADRSVVRCYTFGRTADGRVRLTDETGSGHDLAYGQVSPEQRDARRPLVTQGRWLGKLAVRLDATPLTASPCMRPGDAFTAELWFSKNGPGALRGNDNATNGTIISEGTGYWDGWRVTTSYPEGTFGFEIGRPRPSSSVGFFGCGPLPDHVWHHLAATWDGHVMRLYLDGLPVASQLYAGTYTAGDMLRIGYADAGWGSVKLDVDAVIVRRRALSPAEVVASAFYYAHLSSPPVEALATAGQLRLDGKYSEAAPLFERVARDMSLHADVRAAAVLGLADCRRRLGNAADAARALATTVTGNAREGLRLTALTYLLSITDNIQDFLQQDSLAKLLRSPALSSAQRRVLRVAEVRAAIARGPLTIAVPRVAALMKDPTMDVSTRLTLRMELAHAYRRRGKYDKARTEYAAIVASATASPSPKEYARMLVARTLLEEGKESEARHSYETILADPNAPLTCRHEAQTAIEWLRTHATPPRLAESRGSFVSTLKRRIPTIRPAMEIHVAPQGNDANAGTVRQPLASWKGALAALRRLRNQGRLGRGSIAVTFHGGMYRLDDTVRITNAEVGETGSPVVFRAAAGETPVFTGGVRLLRPMPVTDDETLKRLPVAVRNKVRQIDASAPGLSFGTLEPRGVGPQPKPSPALYWNGRALTLARYPNAGWELTGRVAEERNGHGGFTFEYRGDRPEKWINEPNGWLFGYFGWLWADCGVKIASIEPRTHQLATLHPSAYGSREGMPWFAYNVLAELDEPGEWYLDSEHGRIIVYPPSPPENAVIEYPLLEKPFVVVENATNVRFERLTFDLGRWNGIEVRDSDSVMVAGCVIRRLGGTAVTIEGGRNCGVFGCELATLGRNGTSIRGGDRRTLKACDHYVENCHIHDFSRWDRTYTPAASVEGVGVRIAHNLIHDSPGHAMRIEGNDHIIEFNDVHHVVTETDDQGALDMWFNPTYRGVIIRHNFWHHIGGSEPDRMRGGVRLDDAICGVLIYGNVFWKASQGLFGGVQIHGGKENEVANNLFVECRYGVSFSRWGAQRWAETMASDAVRKATREDVDITKPPFSTRYPALARLVENPDVNRIWCNVAVNCGEFLTRDGGIEDTLDNLVLANDPGFEDLNAGKFTLRPNSPVFARCGFMPIPFNQIGRYAHPLAVPLLSQPQRSQR